MLEIESFRPQSTILGDSASDIFLVRSSFIAFLVHHPVLEINMLNADVLHHQVRLNNDNVKSFDEPTHPSYSTYFNPAVRLPTSPEDESPNSVNIRLWPSIQSWDVITAANGRGS
ncbi:hypothetical protein B0H13DRAFT_1885542 [Mycena leptocephala]|nr:hypothetical protein B0H13DRAFT_1885542 [Mycena leptocephala]